MTKTRHPYDETHAEKIERWALGSITDDPAQQLALVSLLYAFSEAAGSHSDDVEAMINDAMYCAFREAACLHDDAIGWLIAGREEDRAVAMRPRAVKKSASA